MSRYAASIRTGRQGSANRPFATRDAIDCTPPKRLRWYHVAALGGAVAAMATLLAGIG